MAILSTDIKVLASARMTDATDGGGRMTGYALQDGVENNVFPDVSSTDRAFGRLSARKVFPAVLNTGTDTLLGAHTILLDMPDDPDVKGFVFAAADHAEVRSQALLRLEQSHWQPLGPGGTGVLQWTGDFELTGSAGAPISVGSVVYTGQSGGGYETPVLITSATSTGANVWTVTYDGVRTPAGAALAKLGTPSTATPRLSSTQPVTGALSTGATYCDVDSVLAQVVPKHIGSVPGAAGQIGIDPTTILPAGVAAAFRGGDGLVIHHSADTTPAVAVNAGTVDCGRTDLASVRVIGSNGLSQPTGWTVNLTTGIVTWIDVTGFSQPVLVRHTIEEVVGCSRIGYPEIAGGATPGSAVVTSAPFTLFYGAVMYCGRANVGGIKVYSKTGQDITSLTYIPVGGSTPQAVFTMNLAAGTAAFNPGASDGQGSLITNHSPVTLVASGSYAATSTPTVPQTTLNRITFNRALTKDFPSGTLISSMLLLGDLAASAGATFSQATWTDVWSDVRIGDAIVAQYQDVAHPIVVTNAGAITERWSLIFTSTTAFRVVGETLGQIATGSVNVDLAPINPATGVPYFTIAAAGWGSGWPTGAALRFPTRGANAPVWMCRPVLPSAPSASPDSMTLAVRGDIDD